MIDEIMNIYILGLSIHVQSVKYLRSFATYAICDMCGLFVSCLKCLREIRVEVNDILNLIGLVVFVSFRKWSFNWLHMLFAVHCFFWWVLILNARHTYDADSTSTKHQIFVFHFEIIVYMYMFCISNFINSHSKLIRIAFYVRHLLSVPSMH